jgi:hypothetical protein
MEAKSTNSNSGGPGGAETRLTAHELTGESADKPRKP